MIRSLFGILCLSSLLLVPVACGPADDGEEKTCSPPEGERGTPDCQRWHASLCNWADKCGSIDQCQCVDQASAITCASDAQATSCADSLDAASCSAPPSGCDFDGVGDPTPAIAGCMQFIHDLCARDAECTLSDPTVCEAEATAQINCNRALGLKPSFEQCMAEIQTLSCDASDLPAICNEAVLLF